MAISFYDSIMVFMFTISLHFLSVYSKYGVSEHPLMETLGGFFENQKRNVPINSTWTRLYLNAYEPFLMGET